VTVCSKTMCPCTNVLGPLVLKLIVPCGPLSLDWYIPVILITYMWCIMHLMTGMYQSRDSGSQGTINVGTRGSRTFVRGHIVSRRLLTLPFLWFVFLDLIAFVLNFTVFSDTQGFPRYRYTWAENQSVKLRYIVESTLSCRQKYFSMKCFFVRIRPKVFSFNEPKRVPKVSAETIHPPGSERGFNDKHACLYRIW